MPRGVKNLRWVETNPRTVFLLESHRSKRFIGKISATCDPNCWMWNCFGGQGESPSLREAKDKVESYWVPIFRYAQATTWGSNEYALFELHPDDGPIVRAAGTAQHCDHHFQKVRNKDPRPILAIVDVRPFK